MLSLLVPLACCRAWRLLFLLLGILWMQANLGYRLAWLERLGDQTSHIITAQLQSAEPEGHKFVRLLLRVSALDEQPVTPEPLIRVNAYQALPAMTVGSRITLVTSLKPAHGLANEAGIDGRRLLLGKGITATGNLRRMIDIQPVAPGWRARWLGAATESWLSLEHAPLLAALTFGEQSGITDTQWELFRGSGLTHIIAISGQHIALVAVLGWWLGRLFGLRGAIITALLFAATYSALAGFAVATERALIMVLVWSVLRWSRREWPAWRIWLWAFVVLTLWDPFALYSAGFSGFRFWRWPSCCWWDISTTSRGCGRSSSGCCSVCCRCNWRCFEGDSAPRHGDQPAGGTALLYRHHSAGADRGLAGTGLGCARLRPVLAGGSGAGVGAGDPGLAGRSVATVVAAARLVAAVLYLAVAALVRLALASCPLALAAGGARAVVGTLACTCSLAT